MATTNEGQYKYLDYEGLKEFTKILKGKFDDVNAVINGKSKVEFTRILNSGTHIGTIKIDGASTTLFAPSSTPDTTYTFVNGTGGSFKVTPLGGTQQTVTVGVADHTQPYTTLTGSTTTANQAIVSTGEANKWTLKTLGSNAFSSTDFVTTDELTSGLSGKLGKNEMAADSDKLDGQDSTYYATAESVNNLTTVVGTKAPIVNPTFTGTPKAPTAATGTKTTQIATTEFVNNEINNILQASDAMRFKGTLGTGGTITTLPASHSTGDTYKVITAGTYAGAKCEIGDMIICIADGTTANNAHWTVVQTNTDGHVVGPESSTNNGIAVFDGTTGKVIKSSTTTLTTLANTYATKIELTDGLVTKLNTSGGTISNSWSSPFVLNNTSTTGEIGMKLTLAGADKGWVGYNDNYGTYLYTKTGPHRLGIKTDGNGYIDDSTILHSRNFHNYVNKFLINGIDSSVTSGSYAGIIQAHDADNNPTDGWYNRFKILHGNTNGYYTELAMPFNNTNLYYRVMSNGNLFDWRRIPFIDDVLPSTGGSISGALTLTGTTADKAAIDFSRVGYNYITIPEGDSRLAFSVGAHSIANTKMAILSSGRVGIGTTDPASALEVVGTVKATTFLGNLNGNAGSATKLATPRSLWGQSFDGSGAVKGDILLLNKDSQDGNANSALIEFSGAGRYYGPYIVGEVYGGYGKKILNFYQRNSVTWPADYSNHFIAMCILPSGNVGIGATAPSEKLEVSGNATINGKLTAASGAFNGEVAFNAVPSTDICSGVKANFKTSIVQISDIIGNYFYLGKEATDKYIRFRKYSSTSSYAPSGITDLMTIDANGNVSAADFITTSDARLKDFVDDIAIDFDALKSIPKKTYYWKDKDKYGDQLEIGTSAQELMKVYPECVSYDDESDKYSVNYQKLSIVALAAIDKLHDENAELKSRLDKIEKLLNI